MADQNAQDQTLDGTKQVSNEVKDAKVTLKPDAVEVRKDAKDETVSDLPYHNKETEKIAESRSSEVEKDKEYEYTANGYTVKEVEAANPLASEEKYANTMWQVTADEFERNFNTKKDAELFANTHTLAHATMPAAYVASN